MCLIKGIFFITHSPSQNTDAPSHDETNIPTRNTKIRDVRNPRPVISTEDTEIRDSMICMLTYAKAQI